MVDQRGTLLSDKAVIGPFTEGEKLVLKCQAHGGKELFSHECMPVRPACIKRLRAQNHELSVPLSPLLPVVLSAGAKRTAPVVEKVSELYPATTHLIFFHLQEFLRHW